jgi:hypothetical protein
MKPPPTIARSALVSPANVGSATGRLGSSSQNASGFASANERATGSGTREA